ncbi:MAG: hypothetical protein RI897_2114 [Verrucomicrobiota bacterium]
MGGAWHHGVLRARGNWRFGQEMAYGIWDMGYGIWDMGYGRWEMGYRRWEIGGRPLTPEMALFVSICFHLRSPAQTPTEFQSFGGSDLQSGARNQEPEFHPQSRSPRSQS